MRTEKTTPQCRSATSPLEWTNAEMEKLCWDSGVLSKTIVHGFRKAATDAFLCEGFRLATITRDFDPFEHIHKLSLYLLGDRPRLDQREMKRLVRATMKEIGCPLNADECSVNISGRRAAVSVALPRWAWPRL